MSSKSTAFLLICLIMLSTFTQVKAGPIACAACLGAAGGFATAGFTAAGSCFTLMFPPAVCTCLAGLGITTSIATLIYCLAPTP